MARQIITGLVVLLCSLCFLGMLDSRGEESPNLSVIKLMIERRGGRLICPTMDYALLATGGCRNEVEYGCAVQFLNCDNLSGEDIALLGGLQNLKKLDLRFSRVRPDVLWAVTRLSNVRDLDLSSTLVDDADLQILAAARTLALLRLNYTNVTAEGLELLSRSSPKLWFDLAPTRPSDVSRLGKLKLNVLDLSNLSLSDSNFAKECLSTLPLNIDYLKLARTGVRDDGLKGISHLTELKGLDLSGNPITDFGLRHLIALASLEQLGVGNVGQQQNITDDSFIGTRGGLRGLTTLKSIDLTGSKVSDKGLQQLVLNNRLLTQVFLKNSYATGNIDWVRKVAENPATPSSSPREGDEICTLDFSGTLICEEGLSKVAKVPRLEFLNLSETDLDNSAVFTGLKDAEGHVPQIMLTGSKATPIVLLQLKAYADKRELEHKIQLEKKLMRLEAEHAEYQKKLKALAGLSAAPVPGLNVLPASVVALHLPRPQLIPQYSIAPPRAFSLNFGAPPLRAWSLRPPSR